MNIIAQYHMLLLTSFVHLSSLIILIKTPFVFPCTFFFYKCSLIHDTAYSDKALKSSPAAASPIDTPPSKRHIFHFEVLYRLPGQYVILYWSCPVYSRGSPHDHREHYYRVLPPPPGVSGAKCLLPAQDVPSRCVCDINRLDALPL